MRTVEQMEKNRRRKKLSRYSTVKKKNRTCGISNFKQQMEEVEPLRQHRTEQKGIEVEFWQKKQTDFHGENGMEQL